MSGLTRAEKAAAFVAASTAAAATNAGGSPGAYTLSTPFSGKVTARIGP
ncbi:hypothetical protein ACFYY3_04555 [Streptomyces sp. NPDC001812]|uniref:Uncharacterized protein n=1 Tax=Streptomyces cathayae TaxID=3031124 RepID=A0ABY8JVC8_9ACTN|nr:hypothetical protein [Streptomyces sp. HUAS 5]WGD39949.1 hypothetical protein PYS65_07245 [Streptomyces sp. HUAS 5]